MPSVVGESVVRIGIDDARLTRGLARVRTKSIKGISQMGSQMKGAFAGIAASLGIVGIGAGIRSIAGAAIEFESAFVGLKKTVTGTPAELDAVATAIRAMSEETGVGTTELFAIGEAAGQLGISTKNLEGFVRTMADVGVSTNLSSDQAAVSFARLAKIMGVSQNDFDRIGSAVVMLGNNMETTEAELVDMTLRIAGAGRAAGLSVDSVLSIATAMSSLGIRSEAGGTAFSKVINEMNKAAIVGGKKLEAFAGVAGTTAEEFAETFKGDPQKAIDDFVKGLGTLSKGDFFKAMKSLGFENVRLIGTMLALRGAQGSMSEAFALGSKGFSENTALAKEAEQRYATLESRLAKLSNKIKNLAVDLGGPLTEAFIEVTKPVVELLKQFAKFQELGSEESKNFIRTAARITMITVAVVGLILAFKLLVFLGLGTAIGAIGTALGALMSPIGLILGAIVLIGVAAFKISEDFRNAWQEAADGVTALWENLSEVFDQTFEGVKLAVGAGDFQTAWEIAVIGVKIAILSLADSFIAGVQALDDKWGGFITRFVQFFQEAWKEIRSISIESIKFLSTAILQLMQQRDALGTVLRDVFGGPDPESLAKLERERIAGVRRDKARIPELNARARERAARLEAEVGQLDGVNAAALIEALRKGAQSNLAGSLLNLKDDETTRETLASARAQDTGFRDIGGIQAGFEQFNLSDEVLFELRSVAGGIRSDIALARSFGDLSEKFRDIWADAIPEMRAAFDDQIDTIQKEEDITFDDIRESLRKQLEALQEQQKKLIEPLRPEADFEMFPGLQVGELPVEPGDAGDRDKPRKIKFDAAFVGIAEFNALVQQKLLDAFNKDKKGAELIDINKVQEKHLAEIVKNTKEKVAVGLAEGGVP